MKTEHSQSMIDGLLKNYVLYVYSDKYYRKQQVFSFDDVLSNFPKRFRLLYKINVRLK